MITVRVLSSLSTDLPDENKNGENNAIAFDRRLSFDFRCQVLTKTMTNECARRRKRSAQNKSGMICLVINLLVNKDDEFIRMCFRLFSCHLIIQIGLFCPSINPQFVFRGNQRKFHDYFSSSFPRDRFRVIYY